MLISSQVFFNRGKLHNPYITDGLVAMWDGEWNAGLGKHDPHATKWVDCVGGAVQRIGVYDYVDGVSVPLPIETEGAFDWGEKSFNQHMRIKTEGTFGALADVVNNNEGTIDLACERSCKNSSMLRLGTCTKKSRKIGYAESMKSVLYWNGKTKSFGQTRSTEKIRRSISLSFSGGWCRFKSYDLKLEYEITDSQDIIVSNGDDFNLINNAYSNSDLESQIYCIRFYNRVLTPEEVSQNYQVDKKRFDLPN